MKFNIVALSLALSATASYAQEIPHELGLKAEFVLIARCAQAARIVVKALELYPNDDRRREALIESVANELKETNQLGEQTPSDVNFAFARIMALSGVNPQGVVDREFLTSQAAASCALYSSRVSK